MYEEEIKKAYSELHPKIKDAISNSEWEKNLGLIVKKYNFRLDQVSQIENGTVMIMLGLISMKDFVDLLKNDAEIKDEKIINQLLGDLEVSIFQKIREAIIESTEEVVMPKPEEKPLKQISAEPDRETILKEIEDPEETQLAIPVEPNPPAIQTNQPVQQTAPTQNQPQNTVAQKLQTPSVSEPKVVKIDPYREPF